MEAAVQANSPSIINTYFEKHRAPPLSLNTLKSCPFSFLLPSRSTRRHSPAPSCRTSVSPGPASCESCGFGPCWQGSQSACRRRTAHVRGSTGRGPQPGRVGVSLPYQGVAPPNDAVKMLHCPPTHTENASKVPINYFHYYTWIHLNKELQLSIRTELGLVRGNCLSYQLLGGGHLQGACSVILPPADSP